MQTLGPYNDKVIFALLFWDNESLKMETLPLRYLQTEIIPRIVNTLRPAKYGICAVYEVGTECQQETHELRSKIYNLQVTHLAINLL